MKNFWIENELAYDGSQLKSLFAYMNFGVQGDSCVAWIGACNIPNDKMVDGEDLRAGETIAGSKMLHFIVEKFHQNLFCAVSLQRLFASMAKDVLQEMSFSQNANLQTATGDGKSPLFSARAIYREGDDLYLCEDNTSGRSRRKLSISIATNSPVSSLIHFAVNISNAGTPVPTLSLEDLGIDPVRFAKLLSERFCSEVLSITSATEKVRPVGSY